MHAVQSISISSGNILSESKEKSIAIYPKIRRAEVASNSDTRCESQKENPHQLAIERQGKPSITAFTKKARFPDIPRTKVLVQFDNCPSDVGF
jgi:hypothetical protein